MIADNIRHFQTSSYLDYLPAIYQEGAGADGPNFLGQFLLAFEHILTGLGDAREPGLEEILDDVDRYFDPGRTPSEFLDWLAGWVALTLRQDLDEHRRRELIARAVSLYCVRGTRQGLEQLILIYSGLPPTIEELDNPIQIGVHSRIGLDTRLDGGGPHFFHVTVRLSASDPEQMRQKGQVIRAIIDMEKPAHTHYALTVEAPELQIGKCSAVGVDTLLGLSRG